MSKHERALPTSSDRSDESIFPSFDIDLPLPRDTPPPADQVEAPQSGEGSGLLPRLGGWTGTAVVSLPELSAALRNTSVPTPDEKQVGWEEACRRVGAWRALGLTIGFTNGCYDLIHPGHVRLLTTARAACDRLVVALNSDHSVSRLKGPLRPIQDETARATVVASIAAVDLVVLFTEDTPERLLEVLRPDILFKGADHSLEQVVGADLVASYGGRVELVPLQPGSSTDGTLRRIVEARQAA